MTQVAPIDDPTSFGGQHFGSAPFSFGVPVAGAHEHPRDGIAELHGCACCGGEA